MNPEPIVTISAIEHFAYCPRQCALIHCDGVWTDNVHTVKGTSMHRRVDSGRHRLERGCQVLRAIPLWSEKLGLSGRDDVVEIDDGIVRPVEYKSGVPHGNAADLQLCAQALCLEQMLGVEVAEGSVWYAGMKRRIRIEITANLRQEVTRVAKSIRRQLLDGVLPDAPNGERCAECQLLNHCLPDFSSAPERVSAYLADSVFRCGT